jgi:hypothetical protein
MSNYVVTMVRGDSPLKYEVEAENVTKAAWLAGVKYGGGAAINAHEAGLLAMMLQISDKDTAVLTLGMAAADETVTIQEL